MAGTLTNDAWGIDIALGLDGDLAIAPNGDIATYQDSDNLIQALRLRLLAARGELPLHPDYGSRLNTEIVGQKNMPAFAASTELQAELQDLITQDPRFISANVTSASDAGSVSQIEVTITAVDGTQLLVSGLPEPILVEVITPMYDDLTAVAVDDLTQQAFFAGDQSEADTLANADFLAQLATDLAS